MHIGGRCGRRRNTGDTATPDGSPRDIASRPPKPPPGSAVILRKHPRAIIRSSTIHIWGRIALVIQTNDDVTLRDIRREDIADYIRWETVETEWQLWDAPWLYEGRTPEQCERELKEYVEKLGRWVSEASEYSDSSFRSRFEIDYQGKHVGSCSSYLIDSDCNILSERDVEPLGRAIGICVFDPQNRRRGIATTALAGLIDYLEAHSSQRIFTQTWSGNERMIALAQKLGFAEYRRKDGIRQVRGGIYDGLTFELMR